MVDPEFIAKLEEDGEQTICFCHCVPYKDIVAAIQGGAHTLQDIQERTCASTGCGGCEYDVREILEAKLAQIEKPKPDSGSGNAAAG